MQANKRRLIVSSVIMVSTVFLFTGLDFIVNNVLYSYGLQFSNDWFFAYSVTYFLLYQLVIGLVYLYVRDWRLALIGEALVLSGAIDLVYFGFWSGMQFPTEVWTWSGYAMLGLQWTTPIQILWATSVMSVVFIFVFLRSRR